MSDIGSMDDEKEGKDEKIVAVAKGVSDKTLASNIHPAIFRPARTELQGAFPFPCGKCKREYTVRYAWQHFCAFCMDAMDIHTT